MSKNNILNNPDDKLCVTEESTQNYENEELVELSKLIDSKTLQEFIETLSNMPEQAKDSVFFPKVKTLSNKDLKYEETRWFVDKMEYRNLSEAEDYIKGRENLDALVNYICKIVMNKEIAKREKIVILLAHFEALVLHYLNIRKKDGIKNDVAKEVGINSSEMTSGAYAYIIILGIIYIVFSNTDSFKMEIDNRIPFRNNILHKGTVEITDKEIECAYEMLVIFIAELIMFDERGIYKSECDEDNES